MSDKPLPFVVTDRRKFTAEGEVRPDYIAPEKAPEPPAAVPTGEPEVVSAIAPAAEEASAPEPEAALAPDDSLPPAPTAEQMEQSRLAYDATADRLETAVRAANPGMDHPPAMSFEQIVQSVYMQAILQLGGGTEEGKQPQVDILGAKQSIDMLGVLKTKTEGNLQDAEDKLLASALFELRLAFLEITQALSRSAQARAAQAPSAPGGAMPPRPGPSIVR